MCLLLLAWKVHPRFDLIVAANRDELHDRPTQPLDYWPDTPGLLAGRDQVAGGTWLAARNDGRFAAVTNFRDERLAATDAPSRGELVTRFLADATSPADYASRLAPRADDYAGFNLLLGDAEELWYVSNRAPAFARPVAPGIHALSNHLLGTPWPKLEDGRTALQSHVDAGDTETEPLFTAMAQRETRPDPVLPWPASSGPFIAHDVFGTRSTSVLCREPRQQLLFEERRFGPNGDARGSTRFTVPIMQTPA